MPQAPSTAASLPALTGAIFGAAGALAYGVTIVIGRKLAAAGIDSSVGLGARFLTGGSILLAVAVILRRPLLPAPGERVAAALMGTVGYATESTFFYLALSHGTAAAVTLLFYAYPSLVAIIEAVLSRRRPAPRTMVALVLSAGGAAAIAAGGGHVAISTAGIGFALCSAMTFAVYVVISDRTLSRTDALTTAAWVALGAGITLSTRAAIGGAGVPWERAGQLVAYGAATGVAFVCMFAALKRLGSSRTSVVMTLEALFAVILGALVLGERLGLIEVVGGLGILAGTLIVTLAPPAAPELADDRADEALAP